MPDLEVRGIREQDIDLLLWEELVASPSFLRWFIAEVGIGGDAELAAAARSVVKSTGESDLELTLRRGSETVKVFIEDKVAAPLQPEQAERYGARAYKSAVVRIEVPRIDISAPFSTSEETVEAGIRAAVRLLALYKRSA